jgi:hypothetical protein
MRDLKVRLERGIFDIFSTFGIVLIKGLTKMRDHNVLNLQTDFSTFHTRGTAQVVTL